MTISVSAAHRAFLSLADWLIGEPCAFRCENSSSPTERDLTFFDSLFPQRDPQVRAALLTTDRFGAPIVEIDERQNGYECVRPLVSITDEADLRVVACAAPDADRPERLAGIGVDVLNVDDFLDMIDWSDELLQSTFHDKEIAEANDKGAHLKAITLARAFSAKEAAFKAWANIYHDHESRIVKAEGWCYLSDHYTVPLRCRLRKGCVCGLTNALFDDERYQVLTRSTFIDERHLATLATCRLAVAPVRGK